MTISGEYKLQDMIQKLRCQKPSTSSIDRLQGRFTRENTPGKDQASVNKYTTNKR